MHRLFFIVGVGRSGTSLLQSILTSHSQIAIPPETGFVRKNIFSWEKNKSLNFDKYTEINPKLARVEELFDDRQTKEYKTDVYFYTAFLKKYVANNNKSLTGDKDPRLIEFIDAASAIFPEARFIHLIRDPRDVLLSKKKAAWSKGKPSWYHTFANYVQLKMGEWQGKQLDNGRYLVMTYEDILGSPEATISKVCNFLNVNFESTMLSFQDKAKELVSEEEKQWKKETMGPLLKNNTGKWKGKLTVKEVALTEKLCEQAFHIGGYESSGAAHKLTLPQKAWLAIQVSLLKGSGQVYMWGRLLMQKVLVRWKY